MKKLCTYCKKDNDTPAYKLCSKCRARGRAKAEKTLANRRSSNTCLCCGKPRDIPGVTYCSACKKKYAERHARKAKSKEYRQSWTSRKRLAIYGVSENQYNQMLQDQNGVCLICGKTNSNGRSLSVDHCHSTGKVRGLLCDNCNRALGLFQDSPELLEKAAEYLRRYK